jgi:hypothetical protein
MVADRHAQLLPIKTAKAFQAERLPSSAAAVFGLINAHAPITAKKFEHDIRADQHAAASAR